MEIQTVIQNFNIDRYLNPNMQLYGNNLQNIYELWCQKDCQLKIPQIKAVAFAPLILSKYPKITTETTDILTSADTGIDDIIKPCVAGDYGIALSKNEGTNSYPVIQKFKFRQIYNTLNSLYILYDFKTKKVITYIAKNNFNPDLFTITESDVLKFQYNSIELNIDDYDDFDIWDIDKVSQAGVSYRYFQITGDVTKFKFITHDTMICDYLKYVNLNENKEIIFQGICNGQYNIQYGYVVELTKVDLPIVSPEIRIKQLINYDLHIPYIITAYMASNNMYTPQISQKVVGKQDAMSFSDNSNVILIQLYNSGELMQISDDKNLLSKIYLQHDELKDSTSLRNPHKYKDYFKLSLNISQ